MKVLITGGAGQVGSTVADLLLARGDAVLSIDNFATGRRDNLAPHPRLTEIEGSIVDHALGRTVVRRIQARRRGAHRRLLQGPDDWYSDAQVNAVGTANIAKACKSHRVRRLIYFQTALCYGTKPLQSPITLDHPINPVNSSYAISKTAGEHYVQFSGVDWVTFRLANVIGPRNVSGPLPIFYQRLSEGKRCFVTVGAARFLLCRRSRRHRRARDRRRWLWHLSLFVRQAMWRSRSSMMPSSAR